MVHYNRFGNREKKMKNSLWNRNWVQCIQLSRIDAECKPRHHRRWIHFDLFRYTHTHTHWAMCCTLRSFVLIFFFFGFSQQNDNKQNNLDEKNNAVSCFFLDCHRLVLLSVIIVLVRKNRSQLNNNSNVKNEKKRKKTRTFCDKKTHIESYHEIASM